MLFGQHGFQRLCPDGVAFLVWVQEVGHVLLGDRAVGAEPVLGDVEEGDVLGVMEAPRK